MTHSASLVRLESAAGPLWCGILRPQRIHRAGFWLAFQGYRAWLDPFEMERFQLLAEELGTRMVVVESPGFGHDGSRLTWAERIEAVQGNYWRLGRRIAQALTSLREESSLETGPALGVLGYSMGCSIATAAYTALHPHRSLPLVLIEPAGARRRTLSALTRSMSAEEDLTHQYLAETSAVSPSALPWEGCPKGPRPVRHGLDHGLLGVGLIHGRLPSALASKMPKRILVFRGRESLICDAQSLADLVEIGGVRQDRVIEIDGGHGLWHSFPRVRILAGNVQAWAEEADD